MTKANFFLAPTGAQGEGILCVRSFIRSSVRVGYFAE